MTQKYELVIFDVDGTILDTTEGVLSAVKHTIRAFDMDMLSDEQLARFIGPPIQNSFRRRMGWKEKSCRSWRMFSGNSIKKKIC